MDKENHTLPLSEVIEAIKESIDEWNEANSVMLEMQMERMVEDMESLADFIEEQLAAWPDPARAALDKELSRKKPTLAGEQYLEDVLRYLCFDSKSVGERLITDEMKIRGFDGLEIIDSSKMGGFAVAYRTNDKHIAIAITNGLKVSLAEFPAERARDVVNGLAKAIAFADPYDGPNLDISW